MLEEILKDIVIICLVAVPVVVLVDHLKLPAIIGFLVTGIIIGPFGLGWIEGSENIKFLAEVGVALLLFSVGLEFSFHQLMAIRRITLLGGSLQISLTILATVLCTHLMGWGWYQGLFLGCVVALSSTTTVLHSLVQYKWMDAPYGRIATGILLFQDLSLIPMIILISGLAAATGSAPIMGNVELGLRIMALMLFLLALGKWGIAPLLHAVMRTGSKELFVMILLALAMGLATLAQKAGLSFALGSFAAGMLIGLTPYRHHALAEISPFRYAFSALFFVSIGMLFHIPYFLENILTIGALLLALPLLKVFLITGIVLLFGYPLKTALITGLLMGQLGEFAFLLAEMGMDLNIIGPDTYNLIIALTVITLIVTPLAIRVAPPIGDWIGDLKWLHRLARRRAQAHAIRTPMKDHVIICGFGPLGETLGRFLEEIAVPYIILELNPLTAKRIQKANKPVLIGDGANVALLELADIQHAKAIAITAPDHVNIVSIIQRAKKLNPDIMVITRSRYRDQAEGLYAEGANVVISEELESGIEMGRYLLDFFGMSKEETKKKIEKIRDFGSADFF